ncbi:methylenetetrahydrofolate reductase [Kineococcus rubinsiae]|uniref:methylenetetrahydrofolate reductase n=1 Tax=Kineococcus rubinsiae TaxID=2609562 RepID=UPI0014301993|nr:methylenetetrahydrofolate reductase [Kineococcus rubinsiae]NIZ93184.1 5,10-methylenetetrahydrofolate reductase [Kineococcus rubinsiae]
MSTLPADLLAARGRFSVEFSPAHDADGARRQWQAVRRLERLGPVFASVTYGAGGGSRDGTVELAGRLARESSVRPLAHVTAVGQPVADLRRVLDDLADAGVRDVLALRGDPDGDPSAPWVAHPDGLEHADELVRLAREHGARSVAVAAFPLGHPASRDLDADTRHLLGKLRAGADLAVAQLSLDVEDFLRLRDRLAAALAADGLDPVPLLPGLLPLTSRKVLDVAARLTGAPVPAWVADRLDPLGEDRDAFRAEGLRMALEGGRRLLDEGVPVLHLYSLNRSRAVTELVTELGLAAPGRVPAP